MKRYTVKLPGKALEEVVALCQRGLDDPFPVIDWRPIAEHVEVKRYGRGTTGSVAVTVPEADFLGDLIKHPEGRRRLKGLKNWAWKTTRPLGPHPAP